jgi:hypothetical protein
MSICRRRGGGRASGGLVGASIGSSFKTLRNRNLPNLIRAKDILTLVKRGEPDISPELLEACQRTASNMMDAQGRDKTIIYCNWMRFAESGKLRGIRGWREDKPVCPEEQPETPQESSAVQTVP